MFGTARCSGVTDILVAIATHTATFIDLVVAIVVEVISADLLTTRQDLIHTHPRPLIADTRLCAFFADPDAFGACGACVTRPRIAILAALATTGGVIDLAVTIVIEVVAALIGLRQNLACTASPLVAAARLCTIFAGSCIAGVGGACVAGACIAVLAASAAFIDLTIAVVVEVIATNFVRRGSDIADAAAPYAALAGLFASAARPDILCSGGACVTGARLSVLARGVALGIFIDEAIAIVIDAIAKLACRLDLPFAPPPLSVCAFSLSAFAGADVVGADGAFVTVLCFAFATDSGDTSIADAFFARFAIAILGARRGEDIADAAAIFAEFGTFAIGIVATFTAATSALEEEGEEKKEEGEEAEERREKRERKDSFHDPAPYMAS